MALLFSDLFNVHLIHQVLECILLLRLQTMFVYFYVYFFIYTPCFFIYIPFTFFYIPCLCFMYTFSYIDFKFLRRRYFVFCFIYQLSPINRDSLIVCVCVCVYNGINKNVYLVLCVLVAQLCLTLHDPMDWSPPVSSTHGILQVRILEWFVILLSKRSSPPRYRTHISRIAGRLFTI